MKLIKQQHPNNKEKTLYLLAIGRNEAVLLDGLVKRSLRTMPEVFENLPQIATLQTMSRTFNEIIPNIDIDKGGEWITSLEIVKRSKQARRRILLFEKDPHCHWCGKEVILDNKEEKSENYATIDHLNDRIEKRPRPDLKNKETTVLSCRKCNQERATKKIKSLSKSEYPDLEEALCFRRFKKWEERFEKAWDKGIFNNKTSLRGFIKNVSSDAFSSGRYKPFN